MATITVTNTLDSGAGSLRAAIVGASAGDTIVFSSVPAGATITLASPLSVTTGITIDGSITGSGVIVSGANAVTDMTISTSGAVLLENISLDNGTGSGLGGGSPGAAGGSAAGGLYVSAGTVTLSSVTFSNDTAFGGSGSAGAAGTSASPNGGAGGAGGNAGGAIFNLGVLNVDATDRFSVDTGIGGKGGYGGSGYTKTAQGGTQAGYGGGGGGGGVGAGAIFNAGKVNLSGTLNASGIQGTGGQGGYGGNGGDVGVTGVNPYSATGGSGGGGGLYGMVGNNGTQGSSSSQTGTGGTYGLGGGVGMQGGHGGRGSGPKSPGGGGGGGGGGVGVNGIYNVACYVEGTRILTARGEIPVEHLAIGEPVLSLGAGLAAIKWLGHRRVDCRRHPNPQDLWPIRIRAHAFAANVPHRDLLLSPDHAVLVDGALIPIRHLVNGTTIAREPTDSVTYWHVELARHDVVLAEGLPAETYLDTGNRHAFTCDDHATISDPAYALRVWEASACAPLTLTGPALAAIRQQLDARAVEVSSRASTADRL